MITLFSTPKAFEGLFAVIQTNALRSWARLMPDVEVILFGDDAGTAEICGQLGFRHVPDVRRSEGGVPLVSDLFAQAQRLAHNDLLCFLNADIVITQSTLDAARVVSDWKRPFLLVARRYDFTQPTPMELTGDGWDVDFRHRLEHEGTLMGPVYIDWFVFPRNLYQEVPDFAIGRSGYDNWLLWRASDLGARVVDATDLVTVGHQRHDYSHGGGHKEVWYGADARRASTLIGHWSHYHTVFHAKYRLDANGLLRPARSVRYLAARPRRAAGHALRFTRAPRRKVQDLRTRRRLKTDAEVTNA